MKGYLLGVHCSKINIQKKYNEIKQNIVGTIQYASMMQKNTKRSTYIYYE